MKKLLLILGVLLIGITAFAGSYENELNERIEMKKVVKTIDAVSPKGKNKEEDTVDNLVVTKVKKTDLLTIVK